MKTRWTVLIKTRGGFKVANGPWSDGKPAIAWTFDRAKAEDHVGSHKNRRVVDADALGATKTTAEVERIWAKALRKVEGE